MASTQSASLVRRGITAAVIANAALIGVGLVLTPTTLSASAQGVSGLVAALAILVLYGLIGRFGSRFTEKANPAVLRLGGRFGLAIGAVFAAEMLFEYLVSPSSTRLALIEFGSVFLLLILAGAWGAQTTGRISHGILTAVWSGLIGSLMWVGALLITYYVFLGTQRQDAVLAADQTFKDFAASGMTDLRAFIMQDFLGAIFFHSLLSLILGGGLGALGGLIGKAIVRLRRGARAGSGDL